MKLKKMIELFPMYSTSDSIFQPMIEYGAPWTEEVAKSMDIAYFTMYSGLKVGSSFIGIYSGNSEQVNAQGISKVLWDLYGQNWIKLWEAFTSKYNPLHNYNVSEETKLDRKDDREIKKNGTMDSLVDSTDHGSYSDNGSQSLKHGHQVNTTGDVEDYTYGFNSTQKVPTSVSENQATEVNSGTDVTTTEDSGTTDDTRRYSRNDETTDSTIDNDTVNENVSRTREGIVGQNSYQDLLLKEFELWRWSFFTHVFDDCDRILCLSTWLCI